MHQLIHFADKFVDEDLPVTKVSALYKVVAFLDESSLRTAELEWPQETSDCFEVLANRVHLMHYILHADYIPLPKGAFDHLIGNQCLPLIVDFSIASFVDEITDSLKCWVAPRNVRLH